MINDTVNDGSHLAPIHSLEMKSDLSTNESHATNSLRSHCQAINTESIYLLPS